MSKKIMFMKALLSLFIMVNMCNASYLGEALQKNGVALAWSGMGACFVARENPNNPNEITVSCPQLSQQLAAIKAEEAIIEAARKECLERERREEQRAWNLIVFDMGFVIPSLHVFDHDDTLQHQAFYSDFAKSALSFNACMSGEPMSKKRRELERLTVLRRLSNRTKRLAQQHAGAKRCAMHIKPIKSKSVKYKTHYLKKY